MRDTDAERNFGIEARPTFPREAKRSDIKVVALSNTP